MRPVRITQAGVGRSVVVPIDQYLNPTSIALGCAIISGSVTDYNIEHTFDDVFDENFNPATAVWHEHDTLNTLSANADGNYAFPPRGICINIIAGTGTVQLDIVQAGAVA